MSSDRSRRFGIREFLSGFGAFGYRPRELRQAAYDNARSAVASCSMMVPCGSTTCHPSGPSAIRYDTIVVAVGISTSIRVISPALRSYIAHLPRRRPSTSETERPLIQQVDERALAVRTSLFAVEAPC